MRMKKARAAAAALLCAACLAQTAAPALAAEAYTAPDVTGKTLEQLMGDFRAEHALTEDNFEISFYVPETGERYDFNETKLLYGASTYKLPLNLYYYDMQLAGEITGDTMITRGASLDEAHYQTLVYSNNELAYSLWRRIGDWPEYKTAMRKYFTMTDDEIPQNYYYDHVFCTRMMMDTLKVVWDGQEQYPELIDYLKIACPGAYFKTYLDVDETPIAHKYGSFEGAENDTGIIYAGQPFLLAVYTQDVAGEEICAKAARLMKDYTDEQYAIQLEQERLETERCERAERLEADRAAQEKSQEGAEEREALRTEQREAVKARLLAAEAERLAAEKAPEESGGFRLHTRDYLLVAGGAVLIALLGYLGVHGLTRHVGRYEKRWKDKYDGMMRK